MFGTSLTKLDLDECYLQDICRIIMTIVLHEGDLEFRDERDLLGVDESKV